jgi:hypothetical protein
MIRQQYLLSAIRITWFPETAAARRCSRSRGLRAVSGNYTKRPLLGEKNRRLDISRMLIDDLLKHKHHDVVALDAAVNK